VSQESATTTGTSSTTAIACAASGTLLPGQGVKVTGSYQTGIGKFDYTSTVTVYLKGGTTFSYQESGTLKNEAYNSCITTVTSDNTRNVTNSPGLSAITTGTSAPKI
jgi:hypothetical protein